MTLKRIEQEAMHLATSGRATDDDVRRLAYLVAQLAAKLAEERPH